MVDVPRSVETSRPLESLPKNATAVTKLSSRTTQGKPADVLAYDVDGTTYEKKLVNGKWQKVGNNSESAKQMKEKSVPHLFVSGRPDWTSATDQEMRSLGFTDDADGISSGAGTIVYWRDANGVLVKDQVYEERMRQQPISYQQEGNQINATYDAATIQHVLSDKLDVFKQNGLGDIRVEANSSIGFTVLDLKAMPFDQLKELAKTIRQTVSGVKVEFSEDLEAVAEGTFTGWMQVVPQAGGKDGSLRYMMEKLADQVNPMNADPVKKPRIHAVGDAAIDIWMLAMGVGKKDPYTIDQYLLANKTPYAAAKLDAVAGVLNDTRELSDNDRQRISELKDRIATKYTPLLKEAQQAGDLSTRDTLQAQLKAEVDPHRALLRLVSLEKMKTNGDRMANIHQLTGSGANGILEVVNQLQ